GPAQRARAAVAALATTAALARRGARSILHRQEGTLSPASDLKQRVLASVADVPAPTRSQQLKVRAVLLGCGLAGAIPSVLFGGGPRLTSRPPSLMALTSVGTAVVAAVGMWILLGRGRSPLGRSPAALIATAALASIAVLLWRYEVSALYGSAGELP